MRKKIQVAILLLLFGLFVAQGTLPAYAETEGAAEGENTVEVQEEAASADASLVSLKIAQASLNPEFSPEQLTYTARVPYEVTRIALTAQTGSPEARKVINGTSDLKVGENVITIEVTAKDGTVREYRVILTREESTGSGEETMESGETLQEETSQEESYEESSYEELQTTEMDMTESDEETVSSQESENNGGMQTAAPSGNDSEGDGFFAELLSNHRLLLVILCAICAILLLVILVILLLRRGSWTEEEEEEEDEEEYDSEEEYDFHEAQVADAEEEILDFDELEEESDEDLDEILLQLEKKVENDPEEDLGEDLDVDLGEDLDDDFEMLLEDDDDFDFLEF